MARLDSSVQQRMRRALDQIADDPFNPGTKPLARPPGFRAVRVGGWRIVYSVDGESSSILVHIIAPRGEAYRRL